MKKKYKSAIRKVTATVTPNTAPTVEPSVIVTVDIEEDPAPHNCVLIKSYRVVDGKCEYTVANADGSNIVMNMVEIDLRAATNNHIIIFEPQLRN